MSRVTDIRYVGYGVADLAAEHAFNRDDWKLVDASERDGMVHLAADGHDEPYVVRLREDPANRIDVIALAAADKAAVDALHAKVAGADCRINFTPEPLETLGGGYGFRFFSPDGLPFEIAQAARTRNLPAATVIGSGTVSNADHPRTGSTCLSERHGIGTIAGKAPTTFLRFGDQVRLAARQGIAEPFGALDQRVRQAER